MVAGVSLQEVFDLVEDEGLFLRLTDDGRLVSRPAPSPALRSILQEFKPAIINHLAGNPSQEGEEVAPAQPGPLSPDAPLTLDHTQEEARWVFEQFPPGDPDRVALEELSQEAGTGNPDALIRLAVRLVEVYGRRIEPTYRAAIWGGRTWSEVTTQRRNPR